ncbi:MAG: serine/threonine-protein kinase, partial [Myxococcota bacterium]
MTGPSGDDPAASGWAAGVSGVGFTTAPTTPPGSADGVVLNHIELVERLGEGGMGEVWRARDHRLGRDVAAKVLRPGQAAEPFLAEATAQAALAHPGIVPIHERGCLPDGRPVFTMAINAGRTLHEVITALHAGEGTLRRGVDVVRRVAEIVAFAHARGVLHRDLKPANVMVGAFGEVQVLDWGLVEGPAAAGTPTYLSPTRARGAPPDAAADVFALGATLFEVATGERLIPGRTATEAQRNAATGTWRPVPDLPEDLAGIVSRTLHTPGSAAELARSLSDWLDGVARRARALEILREAEQLGPEVQRLRALAAEHAAQVAELRVSVPNWAPVTEKAALWHHEDEAAQAKRVADTTEAARVRLLHQARAHDPDLPEARDALAAWHRARLEDAEARGDRLAAAVGGG